MKLPPALLRAYKEISGGLSTQHPIKLAAGLALGLLLISWTAAHVIPEYGYGGGTPVVFEPMNTDARPNRGSFRAAARDDYSAVQNSSVEAPRSNPEQVVRIENQIDGLLAKEATMPFKGNTLLNREVKRLDQQIDAMWLAVMVDQ